MTETNVAIAQAYYTALKNKDIARIIPLLHPDVHFMGPLAKITGKEAVIEGLKGFMTVLTTLTVHEIFDSGNKVMIIYDFSGPVALIRVAAHFTIEDNLIKRLEIFFDPRPLLSR